MREIICYCLQDDPESEELEIFRETKKAIETEAFKRIMEKTPEMQLYIKTDSPKRLGRIDWWRKSWWMKEKQLFL